MVVFWCVFLTIDKREIWGKRRVSSECTKMKYESELPLLFLLLVVFSAPQCTSYLCERNPQQSCHEDCNWNERYQKCMDCKAGYYGYNCSQPCRYPNFGENCQQSCTDCMRESCDPAYGCQTTAVPSIQQTSVLPVVYTNVVSHTDSFALDPVIIGIATSSGVILVVVVFAVVTIANRRRFVRNIRRKMPTLNSAMTDVSSGNCNEVSASQYTSYY